MAVDFYAGCLGGAAGVLVGHPFDTVKVRLQTQDSGNKMYRGTLHCMATIVKQESVQGLFKGMSSPMCGLAFVNAIVFGVYGNVSRAAATPDSLHTQFLAGSAAGLVQSFVTSPMELAKTRLQLQQSAPPVSASFLRPKKVHYRNPLDCLLKTFRSEGLRGVYRGLFCTAFRDVPGLGVYFAGYEYLTRLATDTKGNISTAALLSTGGLAGVLSWIVIYPFDVVKSRLQADDKKYKGAWDCAVRSYQEEGLRVFARGLGSTVIRAFPTNAATFAVFTWVFAICDGPKIVASEADLDAGQRLLMLDKDIQPLTC